MSAGKWYAGWDVHSYTEAVGDAQRRLPPRWYKLIHGEVALNERLCGDQCGEMALEADRRYGVAKRQEVVAVLNKFWQRGGVTYVDSDPRLRDSPIYMFPLLCLTWVAARSLGAEDEFFETVLEMAHHCPQGDSHRLLSLLTALADPCVAKMQGSHEFPSKF